MNDFGKNIFKIGNSFITHDTCEVLFFLKAKTIDNY